MKFINNGPSIRVPIGESENRKRVALDTGQTIDLPREFGIRLGLDVVEVTEGKIGKTKVETKQFEKDNSFYNALIKIKGIAWKTAEDIISVFTEKQLIKAIINKEKLPFRNDVEKKLRRKYGK